MADTGVLLIGKNQAGRWITDNKDGRKRNLHIYMADQGSEDQSFIGYYADENKAVTGNGCTLAMSISEKEVNFQFVNPTTGKATIKSVGTAQFMNALDGIIKLFS